MSAPAFELRFSTLLALVGGMSLATLAFYDPLPLWLPLPLAVLGAWRLRRSWLGQASPRIGKRTITLLLIAFMVPLWATGHLGAGIDGAGPAFIVLLWCKLLELHSSRDFLRTCFIAMFLVSAQLLASQSLVQCLFALASTLAILGVLVQFHVVGPIGSGFSDARPVRTFWRSLRTAAVITGQALPFAIVLFLFVPRPPISPGLDRSSAITGVSDLLEPGSMASVAKSSAPAFRVEFTEGTPPAPNDCFWRGVILWRTDGAKWGRESRGERRESADRVEKLPPVASGPADVAYTITLQPQNQSWIYSLDCPLGQVGPSAADNQNNGYNQKDGYVFESGEVIGSTRMYSGRSNPQAVPQDLRGLPHHKQSDGFVHPEYLQVNGGVHEQVRQLADTFHAAGLTHERDAHGDEILDNAKICAAALDWFSANNFIYTLSPGTMGPNPMFTFLFERKRGFCEHYAAAFSLLMRLAKVPSRVVVGYYGGEINQVGGFLTVRQSNAHAWSEIWIDGEGWRRVDPTRYATALDDQGNVIPQDQQGDPAAFNASRLDQGWFARHMRTFSHWYDYVESRWDQWALAYDSESLLALLGRLGLAGWGAIAAIGLLFGSVLLLLLAVMATMRRRRRARDPAVAVYAAFCARLARVGVERAASEGPRDFSRRACALLPRHAERIERIADGYARIRYGAWPDEPSRRAGISELAREVGRLRPSRREAAFSSSASAIARRPSSR